LLGKGAPLPGHGTVWGYGGAAFEWGTRSQSTTLNQQAVPASRGRLRSDSFGYSGGKASARFRDRTAFGRGDGHDTETPTSGSDCRFFLVGPACGTHGVLRSA